MDICDLVNDSKDPLDPERAAKTIHRRLQEVDPKIVQLSLTLVETCMKNCQALPSKIDQAFMDEMVGLTRGAKGSQNATESLKLIQQWAVGLEQMRSRYPVFYDTYKAMKTRGISFPEDENAKAAATFDIPPPANSV